MNRQSDSSQPGHTPDQVSEFVYLNFLTYLQPEHDPAALEAMAREAVAWNRSEHDAFQHAMQSLRQGFHEDPAWPDRERMSSPDTMLDGWDRILPVIMDHSERYGGVLIALFHYGAHRWIISDLALSGLPVTAPVSPDSCRQYGELAADGPATYKQNLEFLSVANPRVGRSLLAALRLGRTGVIYVDGNMGPPTGAPRQDREQTSMIDFLGRTIRVKAGIARLSSALTQPILPLFAGRPVDAGPARISAGELVWPPARNDEAGITATLQALYHSLAERILADPAPWEFAAYAHRWLVRAPRPGEHRTAKPVPAVLPEHTRLALNRHRVAPIHRSDGLFWVDVKDHHRGVRLPPEHAVALERLSVGESWTVGELQALSEGDDEAAFRQLLGQLLARRLLNTTSTDRETQGPPHRPGP
jgi:hypothetical protein